MKIKELKGFLEKKNVDFAFFYNLESSKINPNIVYFAGYEGLGALIVPRDKEPFLMAPKMELERAKKSFIKNVYPIDKKRFFDSFKGLIKKNRIKMKNAAIDGNNFSLSFYKSLKKNLKKIKIKDISLPCLKLREIKTAKEILIMKKGFNYGDRILNKAIKNITDFKTESETSAFLEYETKKLGLGVSFAPIVASGANASMPHHEPKNVKLKRGFCVIDFGVKHKGYCTDITRTVYFGKISKKEKEIYNFLLRVQEKIINGIKINDNCGKIYENCVKEMNGYSKYFIHGLGHGVGTEIHELPNLSLNSKDKISGDMVFTIEPGIYIPKKLGIRIEDTVLMKNKCEVLSKVDKELVVV